MLTWDANRKGRRDGRRVSHVLLCAMASGLCVIVFWRGERSLRASRLEKLSPSLLIMEVSFHPLANYDISESKANMLPEYIKVRTKYDNFSSSAASNYWQMAESAERRGSSRRLQLSNQLHVERSTAHFWCRVTLQKRWPHRKLFIASIQYDLHVKWEPYCRAWQDAGESTSSAACQACRRRCRSACRTHSRCSCNRGDVRWSIQSRPAQIGPYRWTGPPLLCGMVPLRPRVPMSCTQHCGQTWRDDGS